MPDDKKSSGPWQWVVSDTADLIKEYAVWVGVAAAIGALQYMQTIPIENAAVGQMVGLLISGAISWLSKFKKDNRPNVG